MAGKRRSREPQEGYEAVTVRMPGALKAHLADRAMAHGRSLNEEVLSMLMPLADRRRAAREELLTLEPKPGDPRSDAEIVAAMDAVYDRWQVPQVEDRPRVPDARDRRSDEQVMQGVNWMNRGGWPKR